MNREHSPRTYIHTTVLGAAVFAAVSMSHEQAYADQPDPTTVAAYEYAEDIGAPALSLAADETDAPKVIHPGSAAEATPSSDTGKATSSRDRDTPASTVNTTPIVIHPGRTADTAPAAERPTEPLPATRAERPAPAVVIPGSGQAPVLPPVETTQLPPATPPQTSPTGPTPQQQQSSAPPAPEPEPVPQEAPPAPEAAPTDKVTLFKPILDVIADGESNGNYNAYFGNVGNTELPLTQMTIDQVLAWQDQYVANGSASSAAGRYQYIRGTLRTLVDELGISHDELFNEQMQDQLALVSIERKGADEFLSGQISWEEFAHNLSKEWASLPTVIGENPSASYYAGDGLNAAHISIEQVQQALATIKS